MALFGFRSALFTLWNWSQLFLAILMVFVEWFSRKTVLFFVRPINMILEFSGMPPQVTKTSESELDMERDTPAFIASRGYPVQEHFVQTEDGYILGLHRIPYIESADGADETPVPEAESQRKGVVLIMHGFMQCSEAWTFRRNSADSLPLALSDAGYDVWLGNNRGNKYSFKHVDRKPSQEEFWDWSIDELIRFDLPSMVEYICQKSGADKISIIGLSQGSAQSFACLSSNKKIADKVNLLVGVAPVSTPRGLGNPIVDALAKSRPDFIFLLFGRKVMLPSAFFWRKLLTRDLLVKVIDGAVQFLFGWDTECVDPQEKSLIYAHIYSYASVKNVVHWFQMIQANRFQMFDDTMHKSRTIRSVDNYASYQVPAYQVANIMCPVALFYGGKDNLPNTAALIESLPPSKLVYKHCEEKYEHLDFMYGKDVRRSIHPKIFSLLEQYNKPPQQNKHA